MRRVTVHFFTVIGAHATGFLSAGVLGSVLNVEMATFTPLVQKHIG
jgi:hypothetical protein